MPAPFRRWFPIAAAWSAFGLAQGLIRTATSFSATTIPGVLGFDVPLALLWAAWTPVIGWWHRRISRYTTSGWGRALAHVPLLVALAVVHALARRTLAVALGGRVTVPFEVTVLFFIDVTVASYVAAAWVARTMDAERARADRAQRSEALRAQLAGARVQYLDMQLRPHFLFNALGAISELAHEAPETAKRMLANVTQLLRAGAADETRTLVPLREELAALRPYLEIQRLRFQDWLTIEEEISEDAARALVPPFLLQPLVENAVHHGLRGRTARGIISLRGRRDGDRLVLEVVDNGAGLTPDAYRQRRGVGLDNVRERLEAVYGGDAALSLLVAAGGGTTARLDVPADTTPRMLAGPAPAREEVTPPGVPAIAAARGWKLASSLAVAWTIVATFRVQHSVAYLWQRDRLTAEALQSALRFDLIVASVWLVVLPAALLLMRGIPLRQPWLMGRAALHIGAAVGMALGHAALTAFVLVGFDPSRWEGPLAELFAWNIAIYAIVLVLWHLRGIQRWTEARDAEDLRLRRELETTRFQRTVLEVRPEALVGALRGLEGIVAKDPIRAERGLADLGDFLRGTLDALRERDVVLRDEIAQAEGYARLLGLGALPGLRLRIAAPLDLLDTRVPNGVIRALVDAVTAGRHAPVVDITIRHDDDELLAQARASGETADAGDGLARLSAYARQGAIEMLPLTSELRVRIRPVSDPASTRARLAEVLA